MPELLVINITSTPNNDDDNDYNDQDNNDVDNVDDNG